MTSTRKIEHVLVNCECRYTQTGYEAMAELRALLDEREELLAIVRVVADGGDIADNGSRLIYPGLMGEARDLLTKMEVR